MAFTHTVQRTYRSTGDSLSNTVTLTGDGEEARSLTVSLPAADTEVGINILYAGLKGLYIYSPTAFTVETNSSSAPDDTIAVAAGVAYVWTHQDGSANPLSANVTKIYLTASGSGSTSFELRVLHDSTP